MGKPDLLVESRFRNAVLYELMEGRTAAEVAKLCGVPDTVFGQLLNLRISPFGKRGAYKAECVRVATYFRMLPDQVFPPPLYALQLPDRVLRTYESEEVAPLFAAMQQSRLLDNPEEKHIREDNKRIIESVLDTLPSPRTISILKKRFGLEGDDPMTLEELAAEFGVTPERIRQIETKGLRQLRFRDRATALKPVYEEGDWNG